MLTVEQAREPQPVASPAPEAQAKARADLYHFFELALAHPGEGAYEYLRSVETEAALVSCLGSLAGSGQSAGLDAAVAFFARVRSVTFEELEAAHISLFSSNFPVVPCPPYGSLFTVEEPKRLDEMLAIKQFYRDIAVEMAPGFDDLPDHICVELEVMHLLSFREAEVAGKPALLDLVLAQQSLFLDRFMLPFVDRLADIATRHQAANPYSHLLDATRLVLAAHRAEIPDKDTQGKVS